MIGTFMISQVDRDIVAFPLESLYALRTRGAKSGRRGQRGLSLRRFFDGQLVRGQ